MQVPSQGQEDLREEGMTTHPSILAWRISWTEEPGRLQSMGSQGVRHDYSNLARRGLSCPVMLMHKIIYTAVYIVFMLRYKI